MAADYSISRVICRGHFIVAGPAGLGQGRRRGAQDGFSCRYAALVKDGLAQLGPLTGAEWSRFLDFLTQQSWLPQRVFEEAR